jgi:restriction system protein
MDGYQFQKFVASLFQKLGFNNVKVGPAGADEGIDIQMEQITDVGTVRYIVECKHHSEGVVGRPVIQKLHSAVITNAKNKGIIVTSGSFSGEAIQYAENIGIELVDMTKLKELAKKVGLSVQKEPSLLLENCFPISDEAKIIGTLNEFLTSDLIGYDRNLVKIEWVNLRLFATYMIDYTINATFSSASRTIHSIHESSAIFVNGVNGELIDPKLASPFLEILHSVSQIHEESIKVKLVEKTEYVKTFKDIKEMAKEVLRRLYTTTVSYHGANNVRYEKTCVPNNKDITILSTTRVYLPVLYVGFTMLKNKYFVATTETAGKLNVVPANLTKIPVTSDFRLYPKNCMICYKEIRPEAYVCNECGAIVCSKDKSACKVCGKVVCKNDTVSKSKYLIFTEKYCPKCAPKKKLELVE